MKKILYLLLLIPLWASAQVSSGQEQYFDYGIQVDPASLQSVSTPTYLSTFGTDGTQGKIPSAYIAKTATSAQADTGVFTFAGLTTNSSTTINIGAVTGQVVDNETNPLAPVSIAVNYAGATNVTVTTVGSGQSSYVMLSSSGVISFQNTFPTSAERKAKIWLGKVSHPAGAVTLVVNEPDFITSPIAQLRDLSQTFTYINTNVYPYANGANRQINITSGSIYGDGINFVNSRTNPNNLTVAALTPSTFSYRTRTGAGGSAVGFADPAFYDVAGTVTAIGGGGGSSTIQYIYLIPSQGLVIQYGQTVYANLNDAVAAVGKETPVIYPNLIKNSILIGVLAVNKSATDLSNPAQGRFFKADIFGQIIGATSGTSTGTMQTSYNNSVVPQVLVNDTQGAMTWRNGRALNTSTVTEVQNIAGTTTWSVDGNGNVANNPKITITTSVSITTATADANGRTQDGRHVVIDNGVNAINLTCNGGVTTSYGKVGSGAVTFVQGSGRTLVQMSGTAILNGAVGSTATLWSNGTTDYLAITNY